MTSEAEKSPPCPARTHGTETTTDSFTLYKNHVDTADPVLGGGCIPCTIAAIGESNGEIRSGKPLYGVNGVEAVV